MMDLTNITPANLIALQQAGRASFPHMAPKDAAIWVRFLAARGSEFDAFDYDVSVGGAGADAIPEENEFRAMWLQLLKKRIDVVAAQGELRWIIEVKPTASMGALGQVIAYEFLAIEEFGWKGRTRKAIVCAYTDDDLAGVFTSNGVDVVCV